MAASNTGSNISWLAWLKSHARMRVESHHFQLVKTLIAALPSSWKRLTIVLELADQPVAAAASAVEQESVRRAVSGALRCGRSRAFHQMALSKRCG